MARSSPPSQNAGDTGRHAVNTVTFPKQTASKCRVVFTHQGKSRSGVSEILVWKE